MSNRRTSPPTASAAAKRASRTKKPEVVNPQFDRQGFKVQQMKNTIAQQAEVIAELQAQNAEMTAFLQANAELLGIKVIHAEEHTHEGEQPAEKES